MFIPYARKGRIFASDVLRDHFWHFERYQPTSDEVEINDIEKANAKAMQAEEQQAWSGPFIELTLIEKAQPKKFRMRLLDIFPLEPACNGETCI